MNRPNMNIDAFFDGVKDKSIAFCGVGVTNAPLAEMFLRRGCRVTICDRRSADNPGEAVERLREMGAQVRLGESYMDDLEADVVFRTPGMGYHSAGIERLRANGAVITSEMELFFRLCPAHTIAVTGSCGKTTVATIIARILEAAGKKVWLGGTIGRAMMPNLPFMTAEDWVVCELSSFQLISMRESPEIALVTNISPNHLDAHKDMEEYVGAMQNIYLHQSAFDRAVFNADCPLSSTFAGQQRGACMTFSRAARPEHGAWADSAGEIWFIDGQNERRIMNVKDIRVPGAHNVENYLAAICVTAGLVDDDAILSTAHLFGGVENCAEFVRCLDGVCYYNDSIATTPARTVKGMLSLFDRRIILIAGGHDKRLPFDELAQAVSDKVAALILIGATADAIERSVRSCSDFNEASTAILRAASMDEAVRLANERAVDGDIVALSPACASFDMYPNFEARGEHYRRLVHRLRPRTARHEDDDDDYNC